MILNFIKSMFFDFCAAFFSFRCHVCNDSCEFGVILCEGCLNKLKKSVAFPELVDDTACGFNIYTMGSYKSFAADAVKIIKYKPSLKLAYILAETCVENANLKEFFKADDILVPVPMHEKRLKKRGFNQAYVLAETYADKVGCLFSPALVRSRFTRPQADCTEQERLTNLNNAFSIDPGLDRAGFINKRLIVIDDVATTGTTLSKCVSALKDLKPKEIIALVVAHSYKHKRFR